MSTRTAISLTALAAALAIASGPHTSVSYTVQPAVLDGGGARATSASYTHDGSVLDIEGTSSGGVYSVSHGYIAQLLSFSTSPCPELEAWQIAHFGSTSHPDAEPLLDPDDDGASNLAEFSFNMNPHASDAVILPPGGASGLPRYAIEVVEERERLTLEFIRRTTGCASYTVEVSNDLLQWSEAVMLPVGAPVPLPGGFERVKLADPEIISQHTRRFLRVRVKM